MISKIGINLLRGTSVMNISLPLPIFEGRTMLQRVAKTSSAYPIFMQRAFDAPNPLEKLKHVFWFLLFMDFRLCVW